MRMFLECRVKVNEDKCPDYGCRLFQAVTSHQTAARKWDCCIQVKFIKPWHITQSFMVSNYDKVLTNIYSYALKSKCIWIMAWWSRIIFNFGQIDCSGYWFPPPQLCVIFKKMYSHKQRLIFTTSTTTTRYQTCFFTDLWESLWWLFAVFWFSRRISMFISGCNAPGGFKGLSFSPPDFACVQSWYSWPSLLYGLYIWRHMLWSLPCDIYCMCLLNISKGPRMIFFSYFFISSFIGWS